MSEKKPEILTLNALELDDLTLEALSLARWLGLLIGHTAVDSLADGGAQLICSFGRKHAKEVFPKGINYELTKEEIQFMRSIVAQVVADIDNYRKKSQARLDEVHQLNAIFAK